MPTVDETTLSDIGVMSTPLPDQSVHENSIEHSLVYRLSRRRYATKISPDAQAKQPSESLVDNQSTTQFPHTRPQEVMGDAPITNRSRSTDICVQTYSDTDSSSPEIRSSDKTDRSRSIARASDWPDSSGDEEIIQGLRTHNSSVRATVESGLSISFDHQNQGVSAMSKSQSEDIAYMSSIPDRPNTSASLSASTPINSMASERPSQKRDRSVSLTKDSISTTSMGRRTRSGTTGIEKSDTPSQQSRVSGSEFVTGRSQTKGAIDSRQRIAAERDYKRQIRTLIDDDILNQVGSEGGITPDGRLFKAATRMFKRAKKERDDNAQTIVEPKNEQRVKDLEEENKLLREKLEKAKEILTFT